MRSLLTSLFYSPYIKSYQADNGLLALEIFCGNKQCGYVNINRERITSLISFGIKSFKGSVKREAIYLHYNDRKLFLVNKATNKRLLKIKCSEEIFKSVADEFESLGYAFLSKRTIH